MTFAVAETGRQSRSALGEPEMRGTLQNPGCCDENRFESTLFGRYEEQSVA
jgi:hypothetical protein